jgi:hypothetical protein
VPNRSNGRGTLKTLHFTMKQRTGTVLFKKYKVELRRPLRCSGWMDVEVEHHFLSGPCHLVFLSPLPPPEPSSSTFLCTPSAQRLAHTFYRDEEHVHGYHEHLQRPGVLCDRNRRKNNHGKALEPTMPQNTAAATTSQFTFRKLGSSRVSSVRCNNTTRNERSTKHPASKHYYRSRGKPYPTTWK